MKRLNTVFNFKNLSKDQINNIEIRSIKRHFKNQIYIALNKGNSNLALSLIKQSIEKLKESKIKDIECFYRYVKTHANGIENWNNKQQISAFAKSKVQQLIKSWFCNLGKIFSLNNFLTLISKYSRVYNLF